MAAAYDAQGTLLATANTGDLLIEPLDPTNGVLYMPYRDQLIKYKLYRGSMRLLVTPTGLETINILPLESYLRGVVPAEMPASWPLEADKAQAVAARTYAWSRMKPTKIWDVVPTSANQVYGGYQHEDPRSDLAVSQTANQVLTYNGNVISAVFHACAGGYTENSEYVFVTGTGGLGSNVPYLRGKPDVDPNGVPYDINSPSFNWQTGLFTMSQLSAIMATNPLTDVGEITNITYWRGVSGRAYKILLEGTQGSLYMSGGRFQSVFNANKPPGSDLKSNMFYLTPVTP